MARAAALALLVGAALAGQASATTLEIYYGPYCPNSANYLSTYVQPLISQSLPNVQITMLPFAIDEVLHGLPPGCPSAYATGTPCGVLAAPMCALQAIAPQMPAPLTPQYLAAMNFAICDLMHANHGAPMGMTHTQEDIQMCATQNGADWASISGCMASLYASPDAVQKTVQADARLPPGKVAPFIFCDGGFVENNIPLLTACPQLQQQQQQPAYPAYPPQQPPADPAYPPQQPPAYPASPYQKFELTGSVPMPHSPAVLAFIGAAAMAGALAFVVVRAGTWRTPQGEALRSLVPAQDEEQAAQQ